MRSCGPAAATPVLCASSDSLARVQITTRKALAGAFGEGWSSGEHNKKAKMSKAQGGHPRPRGSGCVPRGRQAVVPPGRGLIYGAEGRQGRPDWKGLAARSALLSSAFFPPCYVKAWHGAHFRRGKQAALQSAGVESAQQGRVRALSWRSRALATAPACTCLQWKCPCHGWQLQQRQQVAQSTRTCSSGVCSIVYKVGASRS